MTTTHDMTEHCAYWLTPAAEAVCRTRDEVHAIAMALDPDQAAGALADLEAARMVRDFAAGLVRDFAVTARTEGASWDRIGAALGLERRARDRGEDLGEAAWSFLAEGRLPGDPYPGAWAGIRPAVSWTCPTCGNRVEDRGPFVPHPDDAEPGHATHCARRTATIDALLMRWQHDTVEASTVDDFIDGEVITEIAVVDEPGTGGVSGRW